MICVTCDRSVSYEVTDRHYGVAMSRCGCGVKPIVPVVIEPLVKNSLAYLIPPEERDGQRLPPIRDRVKGYTIFTNGQRTFYGTCVVCKIEFESVHARKTCATTACYRASKKINDPMVPKVCPICGKEYQTRKAKPRKACFQCHQDTVVSPAKKAERAAARQRRSNG